MKIFIVTYSSDSYEDWREYLVFATQDRGKAEKYIEKANGIIERWRPFFREKVLSESDFEYSTFVTRHNQLEEINCFYIQEVELR
jgi:hypothetical protein